MVVADVVLPDYDIEAGIKLALTDSDAKGKKMRGIVIDVTNRNVPQLTLVGRTRFASEFCCFLSKVEAFLKLELVDCELLRCQ